VATRLSKVIAAGIALCFLGALLFALAGNPFDIFHRRSADVEAYLRELTPLGTSQADTVAWLRTRDVDARVHPGRVEAGLDYPLTKIGGASFIHESIAHYWWPFRTDVEVFYIFDDDKMLVELRVRKTTDAL